HFRSCLEEFSGPAKARPKRQTRRYHRELERASYRFDAEIQGRRLHEKTQRTRSQIVQAGEPRLSKSADRRRNRRITDGFSEPSDRHEIKTRAHRLGATGRGCGNCGWIGRHRQCAPSPRGFVAHRLCHRCRGSKVDGTVSIRRRMERVSVKREYPERGMTTAQYQDAEEKW